MNGQPVAQKRVRDAEDPEGGNHESPSKRTRVGMEAAEDVRASPNQNKGKGKENGRGRGGDDSKEAAAAIEPWPPGSLPFDPTFDLETDLASLRRVFGEQFQPLLPRRFRPTKHVISVLQFNMLADLLSGAYALKPDAKSFLGVSQECLSWKYRGLRVVEECLRFDTDLVFMEEVDRPDFVTRYLERAGYEVHFQPKVGSPCVKVAKKLQEERGVALEAVNGRDDGVLIAFKRSGFRLVCDKDGAPCMHRFDDKNTKSGVVGLGLCVKHVASEQEFFLFCTHLKSTKSEEGESRREAQLRELLFDKCAKDVASRPVILCCDMNANPVVNKNGYEPRAYRLVTGAESSGSDEKKKKDPSGAGFRSAYREGRRDGEEPPFTTYKKRKGAEDQHTIDYIFFKENGLDMKVAALLDIPENKVPKDAEVSFLPAWNYPSDHFAIGAKFAF